MGYAMAIYPAICLTVAYASIREELVELKKEGIMKSGAHGGVPFDELVDFLGLNKYRVLKEQLLRKRDTSAP